VDGLDRGDFRRRVTVYDERMRLGIALGACALACLALSEMAGLAAPIVIWLGVSLSVLCVAYLLDRPGLLGKREDGSRGLAANVVLLPWWVLQYGVSHGSRRLGSEPPTQVIGPGVHIGRRPLARDVPPDVRHIVDLTAEFHVAEGVVDGRRYTCVRLLDATAPSDVVLARLVDDIVRRDEPVLIHCAQGHGRSALVVACVLIARGDCVDADAALARITGIRPAVALKPAQRRALDAFAARPASKGDTGNSVN
jgi:hypothetical protein